MSPVDKEIEALTRLPENDVKSYLLSRGWMIVDSGDARTLLLEKPQNHPDIRELLLPASFSVRDIRTRLREVLDVLERDEHRARTEIIRDLVFSRADVIRLGKETEDGSGSIRIADGLELTDRAYSIMASAAYSVQAPARVVPASRPQLVQDYLDGVRLGQTEHGSYVLTVISRLDGIAPSEQLSVFADSDVPFGRRVTTRLSTALDTLLAISDQYQRFGDVRVFEEGVSEGLTANLCESVAAVVTSKDSSTPARIGIRWAPAARVPEQLKTEFYFSTEVSSILQDGAKYLRKTEPYVAAPITGLVTRLARDQAAEDGIVTVSCVIDKRMRQLKVPLARPDYLNAVAAHHDDLQVAFRADILRRPTGYVAAAVMDFRIIR